MDHIDNILCNKMYRSNNSVFYNEFLCNFDMKKYLIFNIFNLLNDTHCACPLLTLSFFFFLLRPTGLKARMAAIPYGILFIFTILLRKTQLLHNLNFIF